MAAFPFHLRLTDPLQCLVSIFTLDADHSLQTEHFQMDPSWTRSCPPWAFDLTFELAGVYAALALAALVASTANCLEAPVSLPGLPLEWLACQVAAPIHLAIFKTFEGR